LPKTILFTSCQQLKKKRKEGVCNRPREEKWEKEGLCHFSWKLLEKSKTKCKIERVLSN
jgi:hypothetical protein